MLYFLCHFDAPSIFVISNSKMKMMALWPRTLPFRISTSLELLRLPNAPSSSSSSFPGAPRALLRRLLLPAGRFCGPVFTVIIIKVIKKSLARGGHYVDKAAGQVPVSAR